MDEPVARRKDGLLTTGEMARLSGSTLRTVRFYEEAGLIEPAERTDGGHRLFRVPELQRLRLVGDLRAAGLSLEDIREMLEAKVRSHSPAQAAGIVLGHLDEQVASMQARVTLLERLLRDLRHARDLLRVCTGCPEPNRFPQACVGCKRLAEQATHSDAFSVLWQLDR